ncbi:MULTISPECIES: hypothetical protein [Sorangium]|uniref:Secreted protein n=1 Tax=Sorangium cellulosum TaxID=56 RepID=A0A4P2R0L1_SORCE|nr:MULTISPECIES: hypothetical protein [Sorangium]AUX36148.1 hypothetical protein SOCE836_083540 [Sorangium cellulosum]WCQ95451.1 hypothetical protein NQZ70_08227 [Sorangium sp. Soce836]
MRAARDARAAAAAVVAAVIALALPACGGAAPRAEAQRARIPDGPRIVRRIEPADLLPADLDLVVRVDVARMRAGLGQAAADELARRALDEAPDEALERALRRADVVWLGLRLADLEEGDRVVVLEGRMAGLAPDPDRWAPSPVAEGVQGGVAVFDRRGDGVAARADTARIVALGDRAVALVSAAEVSSVARVLRDGPDERRGDPAAEGLVSLDLRARRLPASLARRFPSAFALVAGVERVRAVASLADEGVRLDAEIVGVDPAGAGRARRFLEVLRDNVEDVRYAELMKALSIEQVERTVRLRWLFPAPLVLALLSRGSPG